MTSIRKVYLGDAVYANVEAGRIVLTVEDGIRVRHEIVMEEEVWANLLDYIQAHTRRLEEAREER